MNCLKCNAHMTHMPIRRKYHYDMCNDCGGRWVDGAVLHQHCSGLFCDGKNNTYKHFMQLRINVTDLDCPTCEQHKLSLVVVNNIEVEFCTDCHGVYFDFNEMKAAMPARNKLKPKIKINKSVVAVGFFEVILALMAG
jgi:Zn-finger nucleic acid-binding protein